MPEGRMIVSGPGRDLLSWTAARSEQVPAAVAQTPSPGRVSTTSRVVSTVKVAARAGEAKRGATIDASTRRPIRAARGGLAIQVLTGRRRASWTALHRSSSGQGLM